MNNFFNYSNYKKQLRRDILLNIVVLITVVVGILIYLAVVNAPLIDKCADKMLWK